MGKGEINGFLSVFMIWKRGYGISKIIYTTCKKYAKFSKVKIIYAQFSLFLFNLTSKIGIKVNLHPLVLTNAMINAPSERRRQKAPSFLEFRC